MKYILLLASILCFSVLPGYGQSSTMNKTTPQLEKATAVAQKSLGDLTQLAGQIDVRGIGFDDRKQIGRASLGTPIRDYLVRLDELQEYQPGHPAEGLLHNTGRILYPLQVDEKTKSAMTLSFRQETWQLESFGSARQIHMITELRKRLANNDARAERELIQVRVPALQLTFIGSERSGKVYLSPLFEMRRYGLKKGESYPATQVFEKLVDAARKHNGEPT